METDASSHRPSPATTDPGSVDGAAARTGSHLQLVTGRRGSETEVGGASGAGAPAPVEIEVEPDPADVWSADRIHGLLEAFHSSPWGACLSQDQIGAINGLLLARDIHSFRGVAALPFLADCLRPDVLDRAFATRTIDVRRAVPTALRQWVRFLDRLGSGTLSEITLAKLEYIDRVEPAWQDAVTRHELARRIDELGLVDQLHELASDVGATLLTDSDLLTGDAEVLFDSIWTERLHEEAVQLHDLDADTAVRVLEISDWCDHAFRFETQEELRNAARRLLERVARTSPGALRRPRAESIAAGLCYAIVHGNVEWFGLRDSLRTSSIARRLGVNPSGIPARAQALLAAAGVEQPPTATTTRGKVRRLRLGDPSMLITARRQDIVLHAGWILRQIAAAR